MSVRATLTFLMAACILNILFYSFSTMGGCLVGCHGSRHCECQSRCFQSLESCERHGAGTCRQSYDVCMMRCDSVYKGFR